MAPFDRPSNRMRLNALRFLGLLALVAVWGSLIYAAAMSLYSHPAP